MRRYDTYDRLDDPPQPIGDRGFIGVNMRLDPAQLPPGYVSEAINMRFRNGVAETRKGFVVLPWLNKIVSGQTQPWGQVHGTGVFSDPFTLQEYLVIGADGAAYYTQAGNTPQALTLPAGTTLSGTVAFTQAFDTLIMHRGATTATLQMGRITQGFSLVEQTPSGNGTEPIPNATHSLFLQNRLFIPNDNDEIAASDFNDYTRYLPVFQEFKVNQGSADELVAIYKFNDTTLIAFKEHSIYAVSNVYGDLNALQQDELTNEFGLVARRSIAHVGKDLWFLSELGVMSIAQTEQNKLQGVVLPVSDAIQPLIDRINWRYAANAVAAVWDSKYYLAVPLDDAEVFGPALAPIGNVYSGGSATVLNLVVGKTYRWTKNLNDTFVQCGTVTLSNSGDFVAESTTATLLGTAATAITATLQQVTVGVNNAMLVYDFLAGAWAGYDEAEGWDFRDLFLFTYRGVRRLFFITSSGFVCLCEEDVEDAIAQPYLDLTLNGPLGAFAGDFRINGGTTQNLDPFSVLNTVGQWGAPFGEAGLATARTNLYADQDGVGFADGTFTAPNCQSQRITNGVRFYATNGVLPTATLNLDPADAAVLLATPSPAVPVQSTLVTRGYASEDGSLADYNWLVADLQTWAPQFSVDVIAPGVKEEQSAADDQTKSRTLYYEPSDASAFDLTNVNGDFLTPYREDYSVLLGTGTGAAAEFALYTVTDGVPLELHQEHRLTTRLNTKGRAAQVQITNTQGRIRVMSVTLEADEKQLSAGARA